MRPKNASKYKAEKMEVDGIKFASKAEGRRYLALKACVNSGLIDGLELQPRFTLQAKFKRNGISHRAMEYVADFRYTENGNLIIEDVKGMMPPEYKLKRKLLLAVIPAEWVFREIYNGKATDY